MASRTRTTTPAEPDLEVRRSEPAKGRPSLQQQRPAFVWRHPIFTVFVVALLIRIVGAYVIHTFFPNTLVFDDRTYHDMAADLAAGDTSLWIDYTHNLFANTAALVIPLTLLYKLLGPAFIVGQLFLAVIGAIVAVVVTWLALKVMPRSIAIVTGFIAAALPSQVMWSAVILKDAFVWLVVASIAMVVVLWHKWEPARLPILMIVAGGLLATLGFLRDNTFVVASWALMIAAPFGTSALRIRRVAGATVIGILIPLLFGLGPAGFTLITNAGSLEERRINNAAAANSAFVEDAAGTKLDSEELIAQASALRAQVLSVQEQLALLPPDLRRKVSGLRANLIALQVALEAQANALETHAQRLEEVQEQIDEFRQASLGEGLNPNLRSLPRGVSVMLLEPYPWQRSTSVGFRFAQIETIVWYPLLILAAFGLLQAVRRLDLFAFPLLIIGASAIVYALTEGNVGTAYRHRGEFVWAIIILAGLGLARVVQRGRPTVI